MKTQQPNRPLYFVLRLILSCQLFCVSFAKAASFIDSGKPVLQIPGQTVDRAPQLAKPVVGALQEAGL
ncbi:hypothetical protein [Cellvibrio polysaccharolyticus]|uniref:Uncharacterized protein n=1 Tax=Cellvibrio polysaccharolyticus TaxID=2082724 RepID=A0A928V8I2_9GAMM|nr:hypothetical protein [Cellvibrio polysaccharolyticus]MBE8718851.1 hypothetical protein [Cellvibrio polysaccharolyticus]